MAHPHRPLARRLQAISTFTYQQALRCITEDITENGQPDLQDYKTVDRWLRSLTQYAPAEPSIHRPTHNAV
ncbi:hypothetical protein [Actinoplanes sp. NPDC026670]|uniref:hypothetical protein n=1 Tax=Actinoplanes sp. NPDC026670 TaxID=3154700 RepID=UPI0033DEC944